MIKTSIACYLLFFYSICISQNSNTVLWKISGKNLTKPSYLFGTIHLKDKRIFLANDSINHFIKNCDTFASELHPDSLNALFFNTSNKNDTSDVFKKSLDDSDYEAIDKKLRNDFGLSLRQIKNKNYGLLKLLLNPIEEKNDDYPTFLDGYLMAIAKRMNKEIIGLENINSHESALNSLKAEEKLKREVIDLSKTVKNKAPHEDLIKLYLEGNINKIQDNMSSLAYETQYDLIYIRNKIMAHTIDSIVKSRTLFATCGSAHLGGDNGIIQMLKELGYTLTPVFSTKKEYLSLNGLPENFNSWKAISNSGFGFKYELPGAPIAYSKEILLSDMQMYLDMTSGSTYMVMPITAAVDVSDKQKIYNSLVESLKKQSFDNNIKYRKPINHNGAEGIEIVYKSSIKIEIKARVFIENNIMYMFIISYSQENAKEFDHFFNSVSFYKPVGTNVYHYSNSNWGISIDLPFKPNEKADYVSNSRKVEMLTLKTSDNIAGIQYILQLTEAGVGKYYEDDSVILHRMSKYFAENESVISVKDSSFIFKGSRCKQATVIGVDGSCIVNLSILKGFKLYNLMAIMSKNALEKKLYEGVFNSISFPVQSNNDFKTIKSPIDSLLTFNLVNKFEKYNYGSSYNGDTINPIFQSYDPRSSITYYLQKREASDYYYSIPDSTTWKIIENDLVSYNDTLLSKISSSIGAIPAKEFVVKTKGNTVIIKYVVLNFGKFQYQFYSYLPEKEQNDIYQYPFKNITYTGQYKQPFYSDTTAFNKLITDVFSTDTILKQKSRSKFYSFDLTKSMFPQVKRVLNSPDYKIDTTFTDYEFDIKYKLINKFSDLPDSVVFDYIVQKLNNKDTEDKYLDDYARSLALIKTKNAYKELGLFLKSKLNVLNKYSGTLYAANDSLELTTELFPMVLEAFSKDSSEIYTLVNLTRLMLDSGLITYKMILPFQQSIMNQSRRGFDAKTNPKSIFETYGNENSLAILNHSDDKQAIYKHFNELSRSKNNWIAYYSTYYLLKNNQPVNSKLLTSLAKHPYFRNMMYNEFKEIKRLDAFPEKYKNQLSMAEADLYNYANNIDEIGLTKSEFVNKKTIQYEGKTGEFYFFKIKYEGDENFYLGIAGPYYVGEPLDNNGAKTRIFYDEVYSKTLEEEYLEKYIER
jgi:uncharacterized protein YbaP (TraB family)